jgi:CheY-like chemotaxis protein
MLADDLDILLVEADPFEAELLLRPLHDLTPPERVGVARDGEEALDYLLGRNAFRHRLGTGLPPLVLLELRLPRLDGIEVLRTLRASPRTATVPIVMLSSVNLGNAMSPECRRRSQHNLINFSMSRAHGSSWPPFMIRSFNFARGSFKSDAVSVTMMRPLRYTELPTSFTPAMGNAR